MKIAFIGAGNMGGAIARGLYSAKICKAEDLFIADPCQANLDSFKALDSKIFTTTNNNEAVEKAEYVVVAVKPWLVETVCSGIKSSLKPGQHKVISIAAGVALETVKSYVGEGIHLFRVLPNTAIALKESMSFICQLGATKEEEEMVFNLFSSLGMALMIPEGQMSAFTSVSSCGIAYALRFLRAMSEGACELGIRPDVAHKVVAQTMIGAAQLILQNESHPEVEIDKVTTPGGWTIKGLNAMEINGFTKAVLEGIRANK
ncbi:MAG: pyrroline-5-carboxylate reductase [Paludibacteraceae bacterium]|nr:pyrroline-5-carboxylate reductase [Paludibacteraceae bacterium]